MRTITLILITTGILAKHSMTEVDETQAEEESDLFGGVPNIEMEQSGQFLGEYSFYSHFEATLDKNYNLIVDK